MDETEPGGRQLTAADANALAQELNDLAAGGEPGDQTLSAGDQTRTAGDTGARPVDRAAQTPAADDTPLQSEEGEARVGVFPPDIAPDVEIGGSPEMQAQLSEEYRQDPE